MAWNKIENPDKYYLRFADLPQSPDCRDFRDIWEERIICNAVREFHRHHGDVPYDVHSEFLMEGNAPTLKVFVQEVRPTIKHRNTNS